MFEHRLRFLNLDKSARYCFPRKYLYRCRVSGGDSFRVQAVKLAANVVKVACEPLGNIPITQSFGENRSYIKNGWPLLQTVSFDVLKENSTLIFL